MKHISNDTDFEIETIDSNSVSDSSLTKSNRWRLFHYFLAGAWFGILLVKSEVISWFRIQEMFRLQSFHMYGVIGSAVLTGIISIMIIKRLKVKTLYGEPITFSNKTFHKGQVFGGLLFGFGWALTGACPGPIFAQIGAGFTVATVMLFSAILGTWVYGAIRDKLPH